MNCVVLFLDYNTVCERGGGERRYFWIIILLGGKEGEEKDSAFGLSPGLVNANCMTYQ